ncbi:hypothetical protein ACWGB8_18950 [Kitasatospora sp. NPDC054939]
MATVEAIYGLIGVLGGASIGAVGTGLVQRSSRKAGESAELRAQSLRSTQVALEAAAAARVATRSWALQTELVIQNLESDRETDIDAYDTTVRELLDVLTTALYRLTSLDGVKLVAGGPGLPATNARHSLTETSTLIRRVLLQRAAQRPPEHDLAELRTRAEAAAEAMNLLLVRQTEDLRGSPLPVGYGYPVAAAPSCPGDDDFMPFWFAVPVVRPLVGERGGSEPVSELTPGTWYLAVGSAGDGLVVQLQDGRRGVLKDASGIQRG